jgi:hypothetical protein
MQIRLTLLGIFLYSASFLVARSYLDHPQKPQPQNVHSEKEVLTNLDKVASAPAFLVSMPRARR